MDITQLQKTLKNVDQLIERTEILTRQPLINWASMVIDQEEDVVKIGYSAFPLKEMGDELQAMMDANMNFRLRLMAYRTKLQRKLDAVNELLKEE